MEAQLPERLLLGPGPSPVSSRVLRAMAAPVIGHLDPQFINVMNETKEILQYVFQTENDLTLPMSGTGSAGMETVLVNLIEPGDTVIIAVAGLFGQRMVDIAGRCGAKVVEVDAPWGRIVEPADVEAALKANPGTKLVAIVHAETSTGVLQPLMDIGRLAHQHGALFVVDAVTSLGGADVPVDELEIDACYAGTQKCLSCPPGLAPVTFGPEAAKAIVERKTKVQSWYLDLNMIKNYWGQDRFYHHTAPVSMIYALHEGLRIIHEEGLAARFERHLLNQKALLAGITAMGLEPFAQEGHRAPSLTTIKVPEGVDDATIRRALLDEFSIEIGGGLGPTKGKIWRIGLMGEGSTRRNVQTFLSALGSLLVRSGFKADLGAAMAAVKEVYDAGGSR